MPFFGKQSVSEGTLRRNSQAVLCNITLRFEHEEDRRGLGIRPFYLCHGLCRHRAGDGGVDKKASASIAVDGHVEPYDIVLGDSEQLSPDKRAQRSVSERKKAKKPPAFEVSVESDNAAADAEKKSQAEDDAATAQRFLRQDDTEQAIQFQRRAVDAEPSNKLYRLRLAIMLDHASDAKEVADQ